MMIDTALRAICCCRCPPGSAKHDKRVFGLVKDFGTSQSPKIDSAFDNLFVPRPSRSPALRDNLTNSLPLRNQLPR